MLRIAKGGKLKYSSIGVSFAVDLFAFGCFMGGISFADVACLKIDDNIIYLIELQKGIG